MKNRLISLHIQRSLLFLGMLRARTGMSASKIDQAIRQDVYEAMNLSRHAPSPETVRAYFAGKRGIQVDPPGPNIPSWLLAAEIRFEGSSRYFFHPLINLLSGRVESSEKARRKFMVVPESWILDAERREDHEFVAKATATNESVIKRERIRRKPNHQVDHLTWIHTCMFGLEANARDMLMVRPGLAGSWRRSYAPIERELVELERIGGLEALAGAFALFLEAEEIGDLHRLVSARQTIIRLMTILKLTPSLRKAGKTLLPALTYRLENCSTRRYAPIDLVLDPYPSTWQALILHKIYAYKAEPYLQSFEAHPAGDE